jgi:hypothetical protein
MRPCRTHKDKRDLSVPVRVHSSGMAAKGAARMGLAQAAQWMCYLPHAGQWDARLPRPVGR